MEQYDLVVIGAGSGGLACSRRAVTYGAKVLVVESKDLGGTCVNLGCVPKKIMWNASGLLESIEDAKNYGIKTQILEFDFRTLVEKRTASIKRLHGIYNNCLQKEGIKVAQGWGSIVDPKTVKVSPSEGQPYNVQANRILITTGAEAYMPNIPGIEHCIHSDHFFDFKEIPKSIVIIGSGYIATEIAGVLKTFGSEVTMIVRQNRLLTAFDEETALKLTEIYQKDHGIKLVTESSVIEVVKNGEILIAKTSKGESYEAQHVLFAVGRLPKLTGLGLENVPAIQQDQKNYIVVDEYQQTSVESVFAIGDVTGKAQLTPVAINCGRKLADRLYGGKVESKTDFTNIPSVVFSHPPMAACGLTEKEANQQLQQIKVYRTSFPNLYYTVFPQEKKKWTFMKVICAGPEQKVVGIHLLGLNCDEIIQGFAVTMKMGATKENLDSCIGIHPTAGEELVTLK